MIHILLLSETGQVTRTQDPDWLKHAVKNGHRFWADFDSPTEEEMLLLEELFHFHPLTLRDVREHVGVPKLDVHDDYSFLVLHRIFYHFEEEVCERREFEVYFAERYLLTFHGPHLSRTFNHARELVLENPKMSLEKSTSNVLFQILELLIEDYYPVIEEWQETLDEIETAVLKGSQDHLLNKILKFKKLVSQLRKNIIPERETLRQLQEKNLPYVALESKRYFKKLIDDMNALLHELESLKDHASAVFEVYAAMLTIKMTESSNQLNFVMQRLTIGATIFMPLTFIVGVYGMNFEHMPELQWKWGYYVVWGVMLAITLAMMFFFKKKKWL